MNEELNQSSNISKSNLNYSCPCKKWSSRHTVLSSSKSEEETKSFISWISSSSLCHIAKERDQCDLDDRIHPRSNLKNPNFYRINAAFWILNEIRDACKGFLSPSTSDLSPDAFILDNTETSTTTATDSYNSAFPSLPGTSLALTLNDNNSATTNILVGRKKPKPKQNQYPTVWQRTSTNNTNNPISINSTNNNFPYFPKPVNIKDDGKKVNTSHNQKATINIAKSKPIDSNVTNDNAKNHNLNMGSKQRKEKRRIRPNVTQTSNHIGNISSLPSEDLSNMRNFTWTSKGKKSEINDKRLVDKNDSSPDQTITSSPHTNDYHSHTSASATKNIKPQSVINPIIPLKKYNDDDNVNLKNSNVNSNQDILESTKNLERIANIYSTIIKNHVTPSTILELHLLMRLLSLDDDALRDVIVSPASTNKREDTQKELTDDDSTSQFNPIFKSGRHCRIFATIVISSLKSILFNLSNDMIESLSLFPPMKRHMPEICQQLQTVVTSNKRLLIISSDLSFDQISLTKLSGYSSTQMMPNANFHNNPILALPFHPDRDSMHNYRSASQTTIFRNREICRDFFFSKIRSFQNINAKILDPSIVSKKLTEIQNAAKTLLHDKLLPQNMFWFAELFCELLQKIGLEDVQETDVEILSQVKDGKKLQKLHQRITNKPNQMNRSSQNLTLDQQRTKNHPSLLANPDHFFPGHQEFFFFFLRSVDSFDFGQQLSRRLVGELDSLTKKSTGNKMQLGQRLSLKKLLAKFLGVLVFSPNWNLPITDTDASGITTKAHASVTIDAQLHLDATIPIIPILDYIQQAYEHNCLVSVIPWILDFLSMSKWDQISQQTLYYKQVFQTLFKIQLDIRKKEMTPNILFIVLELESFFANIVGLGKIEYDRIKIVSKNYLPLIDLSFDKDLDSGPYALSEQFIFNSCPHMEDLYRLITQKGDQKNGSTISRKMRPYTISSANHYRPEVSSRDEFIENVSTGDSDSQLPKANIHLNESCIQVKLSNEFFRRHKSLRGTAEFIVGTTIKNVCEQVIEVCVEPVVKSNLDEINLCSSKLVKSKKESDLFDSDECAKVVEKTKTESLTRSILFLRSEAEKNISSAMRILASRKMGHFDLELAIALSTKLALKEGTKYIKSLVEIEAVRMLNDISSKNKKSSESESTKCLREIVTGPQDGVLMNEQVDVIDEKYLKKIVKEVKKYIDIFDGNKNISDRTNDLVRLAHKSHNCGERIVQLINNERVKSFNQNAKLIETVDMFSKGILFLSAMSINKNNHCSNFVKILLDTIEITMNFAKVLQDVSHLHKIGYFLCKPEIMRALVDEAFFDGNKKVEVNVKNALNTLVEFNIIRESELERSLLKVINIATSLKFMIVFCSQEKYNKAERGGSVNLVMAKIRRMLRVNTNCNTSTP